MVVCASCATENTPGSRFCSGCGSPLAVSPAPLPAERKVVSALFCDLVGFTATSEGADPEDVDRMLSAYFAMARAQIEAHGGVVEKFIGDAVLGVFGVPAAHEDDPERAVRAALRITEEAAQMTSLGGAPMRLRVGINTGEVLVRLGVAPGSGERFLAGDTINTASRIQSVAPESGVGVGLATYEATKAVFDYEELPPAILKGKAEPVRVFWAKASRARLGVDITRTHRGPFIGREIDVALLKGLFDKSVAAETVGLLIVVGEPGLGKSRLVAELFAYADAKPEPVTWRQGRCLPYGEGISFWALGEILKAHAGILESDPVDVATAKLEAVLPGGDERPWFRERLLPLLGIEVASSATQEELFTAWRRFLEHIAGERPTVLVFEDLHWADPGLIAFLEHLANRSEGVPLFLVGTARPELFERYPQFAGNRINLTPLSTAETTRLVTALLGAIVPPELSAPILERAEGNPLYAEEFVRLLRDRDLLDEADGAVALRAGATVPLPDSIGALLAARLDTLPPERKSMLADAAVVGKVFWAGAVATMGEREPVLVTDALRELSRKELVRPARHSSIEGEAEYVFWHVLARDVAYNALPRASRASRHVAAARWIESRAGDRVEDLADVLAHHYGTALELIRAAGATDLEPEIESAALRFLTLAGRKVTHLDPASAVVTFERALTLTPPGHEARPELLASFAQAALEIGRYAEAGSALEEATASFRARGDLLAAARAMFTHFGVLQTLDDPRMWTIMPEALELLEPLPPSAELVDVIARIAANETLQGRPEGALPMVERALAIAEQLGIVNRSLPLRMRGLIRVELGDEAGVEDLRDAIAMAIEAGGRGVPAAYADLGFCLFLTEGPRACLEALREGIAFATARGLARGMGFLTASTIAPLYDVGEIDEALEVAAELAPRLEAGQGVTDLMGVRADQARIFAFRGDHDQAAELLVPLEAAARQSERPDHILAFLPSAAIACAAIGDDAAARELLADVERYPGAREASDYPYVLPSMIRAALAFGDVALAERLAAGIEPRSRRAEHALASAGAAIAEARGDLEPAAAAYADAADRWKRFGVVPEEAFALLGEGRSLASLGRPAAAVPVLREARDIFDRLGARPALAATEALLATAIAAVASV